MPSPIKFHCSHCDQKISADDSYSGKEVNCPTCGKEFTATRESNTSDHQESPSRTTDTDPSQRPLYNAIYFALSTWETIKSKWLGLQSRTKKLLIGTVSLVALLGVSLLIKEITHSDSSPTKKPGSSKNRITTTPRPWFKNPESPSPESAHDASREYRQTQRPGSRAQEVRAEVKSALLPQYSNQPELLNEIEDAVMKLHDLYPELSGVELILKFRDITGY